MAVERMSFRAQVAIGAALVLLSRVPFLGNGYGSDADAWRVANAARSIATTGEYQASRLPGYPLQELLYALIWRIDGRALAFNMVTALLSVVCFVAFSLYLHRLQTRVAILGGLTLAFVPVVFINSTDAMDYVWALALILLGLYWVDRDRPILGGVCLGLAIGCRITSGAMLVPAALMSVARYEKANWRQIAGLVLPALLIGGACYVPVAAKYGTAFPTFFDAYPSLAKVAYVASIEVWGAIGSLALGVALAFLVLRRRNPGARLTAAPAGGGGETIKAAKWLVAAWLSGLVVCVAAFLRLPHEGG